MSRTPSKSPPHPNHFMPIPPTFAPQPYPTPPTMPYSEQNYQNGMQVSMSNQYEGGNFCGGYPQRFNPYPPFYPAGQQGFVTPIPISGYPIPFNYNPNHYDHSMRDNSPPRDAYVGHERYPPIYWQSPPSQYMAVPHNSPVHVAVDPVTQGHPFSRSPFSGSPALRSPVPKRHRAPTFPGANAPSLTFFEGAKKSDWSSYGSDSHPNSQGSEGQRSSSSRQDNQPQNYLQPTGNNSQVPGFIHREAINSRSLQASYVSQDARNFPGLKKLQHQPHRARSQDVHQRENKYPHYNNERSPSGARPRFSTRGRKPYFPRSNIIEPAIPNITWVERTTHQPSIVQPGNSSTNPNNIHCPKVLSSVDSGSLCQVPSSAHVVRSSSPLIVTSVPVVPLISPPVPVITPSDTPQSCSRSMKVEPKSLFVFNPKAEDFVHAEVGASFGASDEYVGFYVNSEVTTPHPGATQIGNNYAPMAWQVPDDLSLQKTHGLVSCVDNNNLCINQLDSDAIRNRQMGFIGNVPGNMVWENQAGREFKVARAKSWSLDSEKSIEIMDTIHEADVNSILDEDEKGSDVSLEVVENHIIPEIKSPEIIESLTNDVEYKQFDKDPHGAGSKVVDGMDTCGDHTLYNARLTASVDLQPKEDPIEVLNAYIEATIEVGRSDEDELFEDDVQNVIKLPECIPDKKVIAKLIKQDTGLELAETHIVCGKPQESSQKSEVSQDPEGKEKAKSKSKPKKAKLKVKSKAKLELNQEARLEIAPKSKQEKDGMEKFLQEKPKVNLESKIEAKAQVEKQPQNPPPVSDPETEPETEDKHSPKEESTPSLPAAPSLPMKDVNTVKIFNYRDALLAKVSNPQTSFTLSPNIIHEKDVPHITPQKLASPEAIGPVNVEIPRAPAKMGGRRKFFLHPIPTTATYDSVIQQLKGGMLEDIYISGLSPHPSAWKGPRAESQIGSHDNVWYGHVSFYSEEGASKFWELVQNCKGYAGPYQSRYGGFDDQKPGVFVLNGTRVLVNWRHNDQRVVNPLTVKAVTEENATRCLLLTFNIEDALKNRNMAALMASSQETSDGLIFVKKVAADIKTWGKSDSNLQGIRLLDNITESPTQISPSPLMTASTNKQPQKQIKVLVSFIKLLTAAKMKKHLANQKDYGVKGFCKAEYYKDECDESIDTLKAVREAEVPATKQEPKRKNLRMGKNENILGVQAADLNQTERRATMGEGVEIKAQGKAADGEIVIKGKGKGRAGRREKKSHPI